MKKILLIFLTLVQLFMISVSADTLTTDNIDTTFQIGAFIVAGTNEGKYLLDNQNNILGGPYELISNYNEFPYAQNFDGSWEMYDVDGKVFAQVEKGGEISPPVNGLYAILRGSDNWHLCNIFELYDYNTKQLLHTFDGTIMFYHELQHEKMFIYKNGKYAICDKYGNFLTDYIYDNVQKRFNPDYEPFPKAYAIVEQNGMQKYIDWNLNEIDLDNYNGEPFITNSYRMYGYGFEPYKNYYKLESGSKFALYDLDTDTFVIPYQYDYEFLSMNDKYIIIKRGQNENGVIDYSGNVIVPLKTQQLSFNKDGLISYYYHDGETAHEGVLNPENSEMKERELGALGYFYKVIGQEQKEDIAYATIVYADNKAADISDEDLKDFIDVFWNFNYERVIAPNTYQNTGDNYYIKLWNKEKTKDYVIYPDSGVIVGSYGVPCESHGKTKENYVWYLPVVGNGRNALYNAKQTLWHNYKDKTRDITDVDKLSIPTNNILPIDVASDWSKPEIQKAAACNLLPYELTDKYQNNITRKEFCDLIYRLIATEYSPDSDSRMGQWSAIDSVIYERQLTDKVNSVSFSDCEDYSIKFLSGADIIYGMGDGTFAPDESITREQAATILYRTAEFLGNKAIIKPSYNQMYDDENAISDWAISSVASMKAMNIMKGISEREFAPKGTYTVEQAIATMVRLYECQ